MFRQSSSRVLRLLKTPQGMPKRSISSQEIRPAELESLREEVTHLKTEVADLREKVRQNERVNAFFNTFFLTIAVNVGLVGLDSYFTHKRNKKSREPNATSSAAADPKKIAEQLADAAVAEKIKETDKFLEELKARREQSAASLEESRAIRRKEFNRLLEESSASRNRP